jgi:hypothetical protein
MEIGISNCIFGRRDPEEKDFLMLRENNLRHVEISLKSGWFDISNKSLVHNVIQWIEKYDLVVNSVHGPAGFPGASPVYKYSGFSDWLANPDREQRLRAMETRKRCNDGLTGERWIDRHWIPFHGGIDWNAFIKGLAGVEYEGCLILELNLNGRSEGCSEWKESVLKLQKLVAKLPKSSPSFSC